MTGSRTLRQLHIEHDDVIVTKSLRWGDYLVSVTHQNVPVNHLDFYTRNETEAFEHAAVMAKWLKADNF